MPLIIQSLVQHSNMQLHQQRIIAAFNSAQLHFTDSMTVFQFNGFPFCFSLCCKLIRPL